MQAAAEQRAAALEKQQAAVQASLVAAQQRIAELEAAAADGASVAAHCRRSGAKDAPLLLVSVGKWALAAGAVGMLSIVAAGMGGGQQARRPSGAAACGKQVSADADSRRT